MSNFQPVEVVYRGSKTQPQVVEIKKIRVTALRYVYTKQAKRPMFFLIWIILNVLVSSFRFI